MQKINAREGGSFLECATLLTLRTGEAQNRCLRQQRRVHVSSGNTDRSFQNRSHYRSCNEVPGVKNKSEAMIWWNGEASHSASLGELMRHWYTRQLSKSSDVKQEPHSVPQNPCSRWCDLHIRRERANQIRCWTCTSPMYEVCSVCCAFLLM